MPQTLFNEESDASVSPLVDVVLNGLGAIFVLLMIYMIIVQPGEPLRFLGEIDPPPAIRGQSYAFTFPVVGGVGKRWFTLTGELPEGLQFDSTSGTIHGVPPPSSSFSPPIPVPLQIAVRDNQARDERSDTLTLYPTALPYPGPLTLTSSEPRLRTGRVGVPYEEVLGATGGAEPYTWRITSGKLPLGLNMRDGRIRGIPRQAGVFAFTATVQHTSGAYRYRRKHHTWSGAQQQRSFTISVRESLHHTLHLPIGRVDEPYSGGLLTNGLLPGERVRWSTKIPGLNLSGEGTIFQGRPADSGLYTVTYEIVRGEEKVGGGQGQVRILPRRPPATAGHALFYARAGGEIDFGLAYRGLKEPVSITTPSAPPAGLFIEDGHLRGTPEEPGLTAFPIRIEDAVGTVVAGEVNVRAGPERGALEMQIPKVVHAVVSTPFHFHATASGGEGIYRWALEGELPEGLTFEDTGRLHGVVNNSGRWPITLLLTDVITEENLTQSFILEANRAESTRPRVLTSALPAAVVGHPYQLHLSAAGGVGTYTWTLSTQQSLPNGLKLAADGITGIPTVAGATVIEVEVTDAVGQTDGPHHLRLMVTDPAEEPRRELEATLRQLDERETRIGELENTLHGRDDRVSSLENQLEWVRGRMEALRQQADRPQDTPWFEAQAWIWLGGALVFLVFLALWYLVGLKRTSS